MPFILRIHSLKILTLPLDFDYVYKPHDAWPHLYVYIDSASDLYVGGPLGVQSLENKYPFRPCTNPVHIVDDLPLRRIPTNICIFDYKYIFY
jgi:hypothetical protein